MRFLLPRTAGCERTQLSYMAPGPCCVGNNVNLQMHRRVCEAVPFLRIYSITLTVAGCNPPTLRVKLSPRQ
jgi:hypothetical protein